VIALGQTFVIMVGGIDLSVGMLAGLVGVLSVGLLKSDAQFLWVVPMALAIGLAVGTLNGALVVIARVNPVILTFGMLSVLSGATYLYTEESIGQAPPLLRGIDKTKLAGIVPPSALLLLLAAVASWFALRHTPYGRYLRAVGGNPANARKAGIPIRAVTIGAYALSGLSGAIGGLLLGARLGTGYPLAGQGMELNAIVAVILGGTAFGGGGGTAIGSIGGVLLLSVLANAQNLMGVTPYLQQVVKVVVIVIAVALYSQRRFER
jgi:ribose/xylose/arabinose/galactoside ABC-type transport system permease subunit